jgi:hypothetical protein
LRTTKASSQSEAERFRNCLGAFPSSAVMVIVVRASLTDAVAMTGHNMSQTTLGRTAWRVLGTFLIVRWKACWPLSISGGPAAT